MSVRCAAAAARRSRPRQAARRGLSIARSVVVWSLVGASISCAPRANRPSGPSGPPRPNIIFIMADDLGYAGLGSYGQEKIRTPHLDRMAREGLRFTQAYAGSCVCAPSRAVLMTGLHGGRAPVRGNTGGIPLLDADLTVAEVLRDAGFRTALFGKWGLGEHGTPGVPRQQGFDEFFGYLHQIHAHFYYPPYLWENEQKFALPGNEGGRREQYTHDLFVERSLRFISEHREQPFFLYIPFAVPHYELLVPEDSLAEYAGRFPETPYRGRGRGTGYPLDYAAQEQPRAATAAIITRMDRSVGRILAHVAKLGLEERTIVFFTSDNGATSGPSDPDFFNACGRLRGHKGGLYEGGLRVPLIVRWPGRVEAGAVSDHVTYFPDVLPTCAELAGAPIPESIDGVSLVPTLLGEEAAGRAQETHELLYWEHEDAVAVRAADWKAVGRLTEDGRPRSFELYDLAGDIGESQNLAASHPDVIARLAALAAAARTAPRPQVEPTKPPGRQFQ